MIRQRPVFAFLFAVTFSLIAATQHVVAGDYVWARSNWGSANINRRYSGMSNGYGGYYVPRNGYGNNYEAIGHYTNPNGFIIPAQTALPVQASQTFNSGGAIFRR